MSSATQPATFTELFTDLLNRVRGATGVTATSDLAKRYINIGLQDMHVGQGERFPWAERRASVITKARYNTGTLSVNKGDTSLTGVGTLWNTNDDFGTVTNMVVGGKIIINGTMPVYEIGTVTNDTDADLSTNYIDADAAAGSGYDYFEDEVALASDFLRPIDYRRFGEGAREILLIGRTEFRRRYPRNAIVGRPKVGTLIDLPPSGDTTPIRKLQLHPPPDDNYKLDYSYVTSNLATDTSGTAQAFLSADTDEPIVPLIHRYVIVLHALYNWYRDLKDDQRSQEAKEEYMDAMLRIIGAHEIGSAHPSVRPRTGHYKRRARRPWGGARGRFDVNGRFDRLEDL